MKQLGAAGQQIQEISPGFCKNKLTVHNAGLVGLNMYQVHKQDGAWRHTPRIGVFASGSIGIVKYDHATDTAVVTTCATPNQSR